MMQQEKSIMIEANSKQEVATFSEESIISIVKINETTETSKDKDSNISNIDMQEKEFNLLQVKNLQILELETHISSLESTHSSALKQLQDEVSELET